MNIPFLSYSMPESKLGKLCRGIRNLVKSLFTHIVVRWYIDWAIAWISPQIELLYVVLFMAAGLLLYVPFVHKRYRIPGIERAYAATGRALNLTKSEKDELA